MKRSILTRTQLKVLEDALITFGDVVTASEIQSLIFVDSPVRKRQLVKQMADNGWLVRIKRGLYQIADLSSLGTLTLSRSVIAQLLEPRSYVSFEAALQHHGLFDQLMGVVTSVSLRQHGLVTLEGTRYRYVRTSDKYFYGWQEAIIDGRSVRIATAEKALVDMIQFHRTSLAISLVAETLVTYQRDIDFERLTACLLRANLTTLRIYGMLLETLDFDSDILRERSRHSTAASHMTVQDDSYSARWRLYYDSQIMAAIAVHVQAYVH